MEGIAAAIVVQPFVQMAARQLEKVLFEEDTKTDFQEPTTSTVKPVAVGITGADKEFLEKRKQIRVVYTPEEETEHKKKHQQNKDRALQEQVRSLLDRLAQ